ncbi:MAG: SDR family NAD(P)-dependent oxidoreductase [Gammaproteobacteria bacterium]|nr:SDR family NAD(P)-dependent oxidoreductase [Gammaproteobacteria bacterium]
MSAYMNTWVTGATSGLGKSLALALAAQGHNVIASARNRIGLKGLEAISGNIATVDYDICDESNIDSLTERLSAISPRLDLIILNAGSCEYLDFPEPDWSATRRMMEVNFFGTLNCLRAALPLLRESSGQRPHIVTIASQVTAAPFPRAEAYGASKAALQYFFDSLRIDLATANIDVTVVNPGFVDTPLTRKNDFDMPFLMDVNEASKRILKKIEARPRNYSFPTRLSVLLSLSKIMPAFWQKMVSPGSADQPRRGIEK